MMQPLDIQESGTLLAAINMVDKDGVVTETIAAYTITASSEHPEGWVKVIAQDTNPKRYAEHQQVWYFEGRVEAMNKLLSHTGFGELAVWLNERGEG